MFRLVLIAKDSIPVFFCSTDKNLNDMTVAGFISAMQCFAKANLQENLTSVQLGNLDLKVAEKDPFLFVIGLNKDFHLSSDQIQDIIKEFSQI